MGHQSLRPVQLLCLLGAISSLPRGEALLCYEAIASNFRTVSFHDWDWLLTRSMVCKLREGCEETVLLIETGTSRGIVSFKGCSSATSYPPQVSYLVSPPGISVASYSHICRSYLCNNLTNVDPFWRIKSNFPKNIPLSTRTCPTCVGRFDEECHPAFATNETCPYSASTCYSSTLKVEAGDLNSTFLLMGCARQYRRLLADFQHVGSIQVTETLNGMEKSQNTGAGAFRHGSLGILILGLLLAFSH
ncbi:ly6/PLAUR domain-containing protein 4 [Perognathus longimembris pacificus]|uniref:ly6/PLAUR domain-containing protein 4 n=1 Tax=Perognathus longimembris pacificus TaxID=214514 RepID=UPI002018A4F2|nr:ly6/PLAUR domain-containing protein 4 [Perognathus longimembris pacificus]